MRLTWLCVSDADAVLLSGGGEGIHRPVVGLLLLLLLLLLLPGLQLVAGVAEQLPGRISRYTSEMIQERSALVRRVLRPAPGRSPSPSVPPALLKRWIRSRTVSDSTLQQR